MKKVQRHLTPMLLALMGLAMLSFMAKDSVTLRLYPVQGKTYTVNTKATTMNMMEVQGQTINSTQAMETRQTFTVKETNDTQTVVDAQTENMKMSVSQMGMKFEYDSDHPEKTSPMIADQTKELAKSIKQLTTITYDAMGNVIGEEENQLGGVIVKLPEEPISVGSTWTVDKTASVSDMDINTKMTYTVTSISKKGVELSIKGNVESNNDGVSGTYNGTATINAQTGMIMTSSTKSNLSMTISQQGLTIPVTMVGNTIVTVE